MKEEGNSGNGTAALVLGIVAILTIWIPLLGLLISIVALSVSLVAVKNHKKYGKVGLILSVIALLIAIISIIGVTIFGVGLYHNLIDEARANAEKEKKDLEEHNFICNQSYAKTLFRCKNIINNGDSKDKLDLTFVAVNYTSAEDIYSAVNGNLYSDGKVGDVFLPYRGLFEVEPFKSNQNKFNVYVIENFCLELEDIYTNTTNFTNEVVYACPNTDQIVVIVNEHKIPYVDNLSERVGGWAIRGDKDDIGFVITSSKDNFTHIVHEFGHSFGLLCDEYVYGGYFAKEFANNSLDCPNCDVEFSGNENISCPKWKGIPGTGCYRGCGFENVYRSEPLSIMGVPEYQEGVINLSSNAAWGEFNLVSKLAIEKRLEEYS